MKLKKKNFFFAQLTSKMLMWCVYIQSAVTVSANSSITIQSQMNAFKYYWSSSKNDFRILNYSYTIFNCKWICVCTH